MPIVCTPEGLQVPCANCYGDSDIIAGIAKVLMDINAVRDIPTALEDGVCFGCLSDKEMLIAIFSVLFQYAVFLDAVDDASEVLNDAACLSCADPRQLRGVIVKQFCDFVRGLTII